MELEEAATERALASSGGGSSGVEPDRLSSLPDSLLHAIMSLLKARQAVQTCVLSTRWRHLWRSVPCLDVDHDEFRTAAGSAPNNHPAPNPDYSDSDLDSYEDSDDENNSISNNDREWEDFEDFTENLMHRCNISQLDSLRLHVNTSRAPNFADKQAGGWLRRAMKYCNPDPPRQCEGLSSGSWQLKRLYLCNVALDNRFAKHVSSVCHSLEELELEDCTCEIPAITSRSLKIMVLKNCRWRYLYEISSPTLKSLVIVGGSNTDDCVLVIVAPVIAHLCLDALIHRGGSRIAIFKSKLSGNLLKLVCGVSNVKSLELQGFGTMESTPFREFKNLRNLLLDNCDLTDNFHTLGLFLQNSPNLEKLTLQHCKFLNDSKKKKGTHKPNKPASSQCQSLDVRCENLKLTEIIHKDDDVRQLVELLLRISGK
uniref:F-box domain-containing protein n=1 Tax=Setaria italica TaxID=4555 RepID=K3ZN10_SETIT